MAMSTSRTKTVAHAILKAEANGWRPPKIMTTDFLRGEKVRKDPAARDFVAMGIIFNHGFAKALWPGPNKNYPEYGPEFLFEWHLQRMVIAGDPIKYLGENI